MTAAPQNFWAESPSLPSISPSPRTRASPPPTRRGEETRDKFGERLSRGSGPEGSRAVTWRRESATRLGDPGAQPPSSRRPAKKEGSEWGWGRPSEGDGERGRSRGGRRAGGGEATAHEQHPRLPPRTLRGKDRASPPGLVF